MNREDNGKNVSIGNPKAKEFQVVRNSLLSGLLKVVVSNLGHVQLPIRIFESGDIAQLDPDTDVGAKNERRLAALYCGSNSGIEEIHGLVDRICMQNNCRFIAGSSAEAKALLAKAQQDSKASTTSDSSEGKQANKAQPQKAYFLLEGDHPTFLPMR